MKAEQLFADREALPSNLRDAIAPNFTYRALVFDHAAGAQYRLVYVRNGTADTVWTDFAARSAQVTTPASGTVAQPTLMVRSGSQWVPYTGDWALYNGYVGETGETTVEVRLRTVAESVSPQSPKYFNQIYFAGAEEGMKLTLHKECALRPRFLSGPGFGSRIAFADVAQHRILSFFSWSFLKRWRISSICGSTPRRRPGRCGSNPKGSFSEQVPRRTGAAGRIFRSRSNSGRSPRKSTRCGHGAIRTVTEP